MNPWPADAPAADVGVPASVDRQIHDIVVPQLFVLTTGLTALARTDDPAAAQELIADLADTAVHALGDLRAISRGHRVGRGGRLAELASRLELAAGIAARLTGCRVQVEVVAGPDVDLDPSLDEDITAVVREALNNAIRHGHADEVDVSLSAEDAHLEVTVADNGTWRPACAGGPPGSGVAGLTGRARRRGGDLTLAPSTEGTRISWVVPLASRPIRPARR